MGLFRAGTNRLWEAFVLTYILAAIGLDFYWLFTESGLIGRLAMLQGKVLGNRWFPKITFLILLVAEILPIILLKLLLERVTGARLTGPPETPPSAAPPNRTVHP